MQSLRTCKPSQSQSKGQGRKLSRTGSKVERKNTRVDDKIKKRMSMRYADISSPTEASVPAVPSLPIGVRPGLYRPQDEIVRPRETQPREDPRETDLKMLDQDAFDPDACMSLVLVRSRLSCLPYFAVLKTKLANSTEAELKSLQSSLQSLKDGVALDLQRNVFKKYVLEIQTIAHTLIEL